jgi:hypothetical protein
MKIPVKLLTDCVHQDRVSVAREVVHPFSPERNCKTNQQNGLDQHDRKLQVRRDTAGHALMIRDRIAALVKTPENKDEIDPPSDEERAHEPMTELNDVIDLVAMLGNIRRLSEEFVDQRQANHTYRGPR